MTYLITTKRENNPVNAMVEKTDDIISFYLGDTLICQEFFSLSGGELMRFARYSMEDMFRRVDGNTQLVTERTVTDKLSLIELVVHGVPNSNIETHTRKWYGFKGNEGLEFIPVTSNLVVTSPMDWFDNPNAVLALPDEIQEDIMENIASKRNPETALSILTTDVSSTFNDMTMSLIIELATYHDISVVGITHHYDGKHVLTSDVSNAHRIALLYNGMLYSSTTWTPEALGVPSIPIEDNLKGMELPTEYNIAKDVVGMSVMSIIDATIDVSSFDAAIEWYRNIFVLPKTTLGVLIDLEDLFTNHGRYDLKDQLFGMAIKDNVLKVNKHEPLLADRLVIAECTVSAGEVAATEAEFVLNKSLLN